MRLAEKAWPGLVNTSPTLTHAQLELVLVAASKNMPMSSPGHVASGFLAVVAEEGFERIEENEEATRRQSNRSGCNRGCAALEILANPTSRRRKRNGITSNHGRYSGPWHPQRRSSSPHC